MVSLKARSPQAFICPGQVDLSLSISRRGGKKYTCLIFFSTHEHLQMSICVVMHRLAPFLNQEASIKENSCNYSHQQSSTQLCLPYLPKAIPCLKCSANTQSHPVAEKSASSEQIISMVIHSSVFITGLWVAMQSRCNAGGAGIYACVKSLTMPSVSQMCRLA